MEDNDGIKTIEETVTGSRNLYYIHIWHVPTGERVSFEPYIENFSDNYKSEWESQPVLGRMDNIATFKRTGRVINLDFIVPSSNREQACRHYEDSKKLSEFLYPVYKEIQKAKRQVPDVQNPFQEQDATIKPTVRNFHRASALATSLEQNLSLRTGANVMAAPPILKIKFANLISDKYLIDGLYGYIEGYNFQPDKELGFFVNVDETLIPKAFRVSLTFNVIHTEPRGWNINNKTRS